MKQQGLWAESEARGNPKQSERLARRTQSSRVVELHRWRNKLTDETCRLTMSAFARLNCVSKRRAYDTPRQPLNPWVYDGPAGRSIEGDGLHWLLKQQAKNGRTDLQFKEKIAQAWTHSVLILARYHQGWGVKRIAADLGVSSTGIWKMLVESGIDTGARRNYVPSRKVGQYKARGRLSYQNRMRDQGQRLKKRLMVRIWIAMKNQSVNATGTFAAVGCSAEHLRAHLESKFEPGMTWNNYGEWHVDHIRPCASFDLSDPKQLAECFNWSNLQPLWAKENISKGAKYA
jgi:hypothetical protein